MKGPSRMYFCSSSNELLIRRLYLLLLILMKCGTLQALAYAKMKGKEKIGCEFREIEMINAQSIIAYRQRALLYVIVND